MMGVQFVCVRDDLLQPVFNLPRVFSRREIGPVANAENMGVDRDRRLAEGHVQHHVGGLASNPGKRLQGHPITRHFAAMLLDPLHTSRPGLVGGRVGSVTTSDGAGNATLGKVAQDPDNENADRAVAVDDITHMFNLAGSYDLPIGRGKKLLNTGGPVDLLLGGWRLTANFAAQSGVPLFVSGPCNGLTCRPNLVGNPSLSKSRSRVQQEADWINAAAFEPVYGNDQSFWVNPDPNDDRWWRFGTAGAFLPGLRAPGFWNVDLALSRNITIAAQKFEARVEMFNVFNHQRFAFLDGGFGNDTFGTVTSTTGNFRKMQFGARFQF